MQWKKYVILGNSQTALTVPWETFNSKVSLFFLFSSGSFISSCIFRTLRTLSRLSLASSTYGSVALLVFVFHIPLLFDGLKPYFHGRLKSISKHRGKLFARRETRTAILSKFCHWSFECRFLFIDDEKETTDRWWSQFCRVTCDSVSL